MLRWTGLLFVAMLACGAALHGEDGPARLVAPLPPNWRAARLHLVLKGVTVPGSVPLKLRVAALAEGGEEVYLAAAGIPALSRGHTPPRRLPPLRLDITDALKAFLQNRTDASTVELHLQPVDGRNNPLPVKILVEKARIEAHEP